MTRMSPSIITARSSEKTLVLNNSRTPQRPQNTRGPENIYCLAAKFSDYKLSARTREFFVVKIATKDRVFVCKHTMTPQMTPMHKLSPIGHSTDPLVTIGQQQRLHPLSP